MYCSLELVQVLPPNILLNHKITLTLDNNGISETSLSNNPAFMVFQKPETLNQTRDEYLHAKLSGQKEYLYSDTHAEISNATTTNEYSVKRWESERNEVVSSGERLN